MLHQNIETFIGCESSYADADIVLYGAPFDSTTSYRPGARFGPAAMRHESYGLETYSPYQDKDLTDIKVFDSGDMELCFGSSESALKDIEARAETILQDGKFPLLLGGEHLVKMCIRDSYYTTRLHVGAFYLPAFLEEMLREVEEK